MNLRRPVYLFVAAALLLMGWLGTQAWFEQRVINAIELQLALLPEPIDVRYGRVQVNLLSMRTEVDDLFIRLGDHEPPIHIDKVIVHDVGRTHRVPYNLDLELIGVRQTFLGSMQHHARFFRSYGFEEFSGEMALSYRFNASDQRLVVDKLLLDLVPLGRLDLDLDLRLAPVSGVLYRDWRPEDAVALERLRASWQDRTLVRRMIGIAAGDQGMTTRTLAANIAGELDLSVAALDTPRLDVTADTIRTFLPDPGGVVLYLEPEEPLPLTTLRDTALVDPPRAAIITRLLLELYPGIDEESPRPSPP